jgi:hypothetical protein
MSRLAGLLIILLLVLIMFPPVRERLLPYAQPALDPMYEWSAKNRVTSLAKFVEEQESLGFPPPEPHEFSAFVERRDLQENASMDPWGSRYYLRLMRDTYYVGSPGRDRIEGTADDVVSKTMQRRVIPRGRRRNR